VVIKVVRAEKMANEKVDNDHTLLTAKLVRDAARKSSLAIVHGLRRNDQLWPPEDIGYKVYKDVSLIASNLSILGQKSSPSK